MAANSSTIDALTMRQLPRTRGKVGKTSSEPVRAIVRSKRRPWPGLRRVRPGAPVTRGRLTNGWMVTADCVADCRRVLVACIRRRRTSSA